MRAWPSQVLAGRFQTTPLANVQVRWSLEIAAVGQPFIAPPVKVTVLPATDAVPACITPPWCETTV